MYQKTKKEIDRLERLIRGFIMAQQEVNREVMQHKGILLAFVAPTLDAHSRYLEDREEMEGALKEYVTESQGKAAKKRQEAKLGISLQEADMSDWWENSGLGLTDDDFSQGVIDWVEYYSRIRPDWYENNN